VRLTESVTDRVLAMLRSGGFRPGAKLPSERELRVQLEVGRSSIREALQALIGMGFVEAQAGRGYFVRMAEETPSAMTLDGPSLAESHSLMELLEARLILEPEIAALAARDATAADFATLDRALLRISVAAERGRKVYRAAAMFHVEFAKAAHNAALVQMVRSLVSVMSYWGRVFEDVPNRGPEEVRLHRELLECLKRQNPRIMRRRMRQHILVTRVALAAYLAHRDERHTTRLRTGSRGNGHSRKKTDPSQSVQVRAVRDFEGLSRSKGQ
jgi:GntR family transcriptional repressor for pyruvate dehydrogenase complex